MKKLTLALALASPLVTASVNLTKQTMNNNPLFASTIKDPQQVGACLALQNKLYNEVNRDMKTAIEMLMSITWVYVDEYNPLAQQVEHIANAHSAPLQYMNITQAMSNGNYAQCKNMNETIIAVHMK